MALLRRLFRDLPYLILSPLAMLGSLAAIALADLAWALFGRRRTPPPAPARNASASVVIPNWNGRDLMEKYLPSVVEAMAGSPDNEVIVVDNGSTDGSLELLREQFPTVRVLAQPTNLGFGGGSNAGFRAARNDVVLLLNSDMRVDRDALAPLLEGFADPAVFAVACQIFFSDPKKVREETGLTQGWWRDGGLRVRHRADPAITELYPCFYGGGGSCAFDRRKFLELGGFDPLLEPFYLEDTDLGYLAWKRGWKVLYQPKSKVWHEHRGTIGKKFTQEFVQGVLKKNFLLFCWKNIHEWPRLVSHFFFAWAGAVLSTLFGDEFGRPNPRALTRAFRQLPGALASRWRARSLAEISDTEAFRRPLGGYFRDRFDAMPARPDRLSVVFVSPYPICPPVHGGGVFMYQTLRELAGAADVHVVELLDFAWQVPVNEELREFCASAEWIVRPSGKAEGLGSILPYAVREFDNDDLDWLIHRQLYTRRADVLQLEYTPMAQYRGEYRRIATALFEHDVYFQSVARGVSHMSSPLARIKARVEYLRALRYELGALAGFHQIQVCTRDNRDYLASFLPAVATRIREGMRAGIDTTRYRFKPEDREPNTMLFLGSFRHDPNRIALDWFIGNVLPRVLEKIPEARLVVAGSDPPPPHAYADHAASLEMLGYVEDVREPLARCAVFICPILSGSGVRVKLLEAFSAGIPTVSTRVGAEGLTDRDGDWCALADDPADFAAKVVALLADPAAAAELARRARAGVEAEWDMAAVTARLVKDYRKVVEELRR
jgi:GT2 family glycosyltransferase/glycosyltransferase involved in cell wall biosynthesis